MTTWPRACCICGAEVPRHRLDSGWDDLNAVTCGPDHASMLQRYRRLVAQYRKREAGGTAAGPEESVRISLSATAGSGLDRRVGHPSDTGFALKDAIAWSAVEDAVAGAEHGE